MNEPLFKNSFVRDKQLLKSIYKDYFLKYSKSFYILFGISVLFFIFSITQASSLGEFLRYLIVGLLFYGFLISVVLFKYHQSVKIAAMRDKEIYGEHIILINLSVFEDKIEMIDFENKQELYYSDIDYAIVSKDYINIITKARFIYTFKKDSFTLGKSDEFIEFLKNKGLKIRK